MRTSPARPTAIPAVIVARAPKRPISRPENGENAAIGAVIGSTRAPAAIAE